MLGPPSVSSHPFPFSADNAEICRSQSVQDAIVRDIPVKTATFRNVVLHIAQDENAQAIESGIIRFHQSVSTDQKLGGSSTKAGKLLGDFYNESST